MKKAGEERRRGAVRKLALAHARKAGGGVVLYRCSDYDFAPLESFEAAGKSRVHHTGGHLMTKW
jgi:hypothetical protein